MQVQVLHGILVSIVVAEVGKKLLKEELQEEVTPSEIIGVIWDCFKGSEGINMVTAMEITLEHLPECVCAGAVVLYCPVVCKLCKLGS